MSREAAHRVTSGVTLDPRSTFAASAGVAYLLVGHAILTRNCFADLKRVVRHVSDVDEDRAKFALAHAAG